MDVAVNSAVVAEFDGAQIGLDFIPNANGRDGVRVRDWVDESWRDDFGDVYPEVP